MDRGDAAPFRWLAVVVGVTVVATAIAGAVPTGPDGVSGQTDGVSAVGHNATAVRHSHLSVTEPGNLTAVERWLVDRLGGQLSDSIAALNRSRFDEARQLVGPAYADYLGRFVDTAGETPDRTDDEVGAALDSAGDHQRNFTDAVADYRDTYEDYRSAKRAGDETRARELAHDLDAMADRVNRTGGVIVDDLSEISNRTGADFGDEITTINRIRQNVTEVRQAVVAEAFVSTRLAVQVDQRRVSFVEPLRVKGRLVGANGTPVRNGTVVLSIGGAERRAQTDRAGEFSLAFRPKTIVAGNHSARVRYVPAPDSGYRRTETAVDVTVEQVTPSVTITESPGSAAFGEPVDVAGRVAVDGSGVSNLPIAVAVGDRRLGRARTGPNSSFGFRQPLPHTVPDGRQPIVVSVQLEDQAIGPASTTMPLLVAETETGLGIDVEQGDGSSVAVSGQLRTARGSPPGGLSVVIAIDGQAAGSLRTGAEGRFSGTVPVPEPSRPATGDNASVLVTARFDGQGLNLGGSAANASLVISAPPETGPVGAFDPAASPFAVLLIGVIGTGFGVGLLALLVERFRRLREARRTPDEAVPSMGDFAALAGVETVGSGSRSFIDLANEQLSTGRPEVAVKLAYAAVRRRLADRLGEEAPSTHWEFYRACQAGLSEGDQSTLRRLTEAYELVAYAGRAPAAPETSRLIEAAEALVGGGRG